MSDSHTDGKEFEPGEHAAGEDEPTSTHGGGKQFAPEVDTTDSDQRAQQTEGSGKGFAPSVDDPEDDDDMDTHKGSGKQFEPGRGDL